MKTFNIIPLLIAILVLLVSKGFANDGKYEQAMKKNIQTVYTAKTIDELQAAVNSFERIGAAEKTKWEPHYYAAFGYIMIANIEKDNVKKDALLDQAVKAIGAAKTISAEESEIVALEGFATMIRVTVDPGSRGPQYAPQAMQLFGKALTLNPANPRAMALMAQMQYGTAQFFGSATTEACETLKKSLESFETYKSENPLAPQWGRGMAEGMKEKCK
jgi:hypothetical protein